MNDSEQKEVYEYYFHESRFPLVEQQLSPENAQRFRELSKEDKALFINILIKEGKLAWWDRSMFIKKSLLKYILENNCLNTPCTDCSIDDAHKCNVSPKIYRLIDRLFNQS